MTDKIVLGSGKIYAVEYTGTIPSDTTFEVNDNLLGYIQGGATLTYTPTFYDAKDDLGYVSKTIITEETVVLKSGVMTWNAETLQKLSATGRVTSTTSERTIKIGGISNFDGKKYAIRFVHDDPAEGDIRLTIIGQNQAGFELTFAKDKETVINAEFKAMPMDGVGTLVEYREEIPTPPTP